MVNVCIYSLFLLVAFYLSRQYPNQNFFPFKVIALCLVILSLYQWYSINYLNLSDSNQEIEYYAVQAVRLTILGAIVITVVKAIRRL
jgi:hypothetical protein